jgi:hypothetical protein
MKNVPSVIAGIVFFILVVYVLGSIGMHTSAHVPVTDVPTTEKIDDNKDARVSLAASFENLAKYCNSNLTGKAIFGGGTYIEEQERKYGRDAILQMMNKDYEEGYRKYGNLWCLNTIAMAEAVYDSYRRHDRPLR